MTVAEHLRPRGRWAGATQQVATGQVPESVVLTAMNSAQVLAAVTAGSVRRCP